MFKPLELSASLSCQTFPLATMDPDVIIPETSNSSTADDVTPNFAPTEIMVFNDEMYENCTSLDGMNLSDVFTAVDIGNTTFWGSASVVWMTFFIIYYVLFYVALLVLICYCGYLLVQALKQHSFLLRALIYLLTLYTFWFGFSFVHSILIINSLAGGGHDTAVVNATGTLETVTSSTFVNIMIAAPLFHPNSKSRFSLTYAALFNFVIYAMTMIIVIISLLMVFESSATIIILIIIRSLMFTASVVLVIVAVLYKYPYKTKEPLLLPIISFPYFLLSCSYFLYTLSTIVSNNNCIQNVQLHRAVWLVLNYSLRICEVSFSLICFRKVQVIVKEAKVSRGIAQKKSKETRHSRVGPIPLLVDGCPSKYSHPLEEFKESFATKSVRIVDEGNYDSRDSKKQQIQQTFPVKNNLCVKEIEQLPHTPSLNVNLDKQDSKATNVESIQELSPSRSCQSEVPNQQTDVSSSVDSDHYFDADKRSTSPNLVDGEVMHTCLLLRM